MDRWGERLRLRGVDELDRLRQRPWRAVLVGLGDVALPYVTMFPAIVVCAYLGGWRIGLAATALCALAAVLLFMPWGLRAAAMSSTDIAGSRPFWPPPRCSSSSSTSPPG